jgi:hypothetical protein
MIKSSQGNTYETKYFDYPVGFTRSKPYILRHTGEPF